MMGDLELVSNNHVFFMIEKQLQPLSAITRNRRFYDMLLPGQFPNEIHHNKKSVYGKMTVNNNEEMSV